MSCWPTPAWPGSASIPVFHRGAGGVPRCRRVACRAAQARCVEGDLFGSIGAGLAVGRAALRVILGMIPG